MKLKKDTTLLELVRIAAENKVRIELIIDAEGNKTISAEPEEPFEYNRPQAKVD